MALEIHVRGVEKVQRQEIGFSFFCSIPVHSLVPYCSYLFTNLRYTVSLAVYFWRNHWQR